MGTLRSATDHSGNSFNGITLGQAVIIDDSKAPIEYRWDTGTWPDAEIDSAGTIVVDAKVSPVGGQGGGMEIDLGGMEMGVTIALALSATDATKVAADWKLRAVRSR